jgi:hypothetical protein
MLYPCGTDYKLTLASLQANRKLNTAISANKSQRVKIFRIEIIRDRTRNHAKIFDSNES